MKRSDRLAVNGDPKDFHLSKALKKTVLPEDRARRIIDSAKIRRSRPLIGRALGPNGRTQELLSCFVSWLHRENSAHPISTAATS